MFSGHNGISYKFNKIIWLKNMELKHPFLQQPRGYQGVRERKCLETNESKKRKIRRV